MNYIKFTAKVLGPVAGYKLTRNQVTQTIRSENDGIAGAVLNGQVSAGDRLEVFLDTVRIGQVDLVSMEPVTWEALDVDDARRGGFDTLDDLAAALKRAGFRFKPLDDYQLYRIQFRWLDEVPA